VAEPVVLEDEHGPVAVYGIPYLEPDVVKQAWDLPTRSHHAALGEAMRRIRADLSNRWSGTRSIVVAHAFVAGGVPSESERDISVGGISVVPADLHEATSREELRDQLTVLGNRMFAEVVDQGPQLPRMILLEVTAIDAELLQRVLGLLETVGVLMTPLLLNGVNRGFLRADLDVESTARAVTGCVLAGLLTLVRRPLDPTERLRYVEAVVSMVCGSPAPGVRPAQSRVRARKKSASS